jgi:hypothetical protein
MDLRLPLAQVEAMATKTHAVSLIFPTFTA